MALLISRLKSVSDAEDTFLGMSILDFARYNAGGKALNPAWIHYKDKAKGPFRGPKRITSF